MLCVKIDAAGACLSGTPGGGGGGEGVSYLASSLIVDFHMHRTKLSTATAPAEPRVLHRLVHVHSRAIADLVPAGRQRFNR